MGIQHEHSSNDDTDAAISTPPPALPSHRACADSMGQCDAAVTGEGVDEHGHVGADERGVGG